MPTQGKLHGHSASTRLVTDAHVLPGAPTKCLALPDVDAYGRPKLGNIGPPRILMGTHEALCVEAHVHGWKSTRLGCGLGWRPIELRLGSPRDGIGLPRNSRGCPKRAVIGCPLTSNARPTMLDGGPRYAGGRPSRLQPYAMGSHIHAVDFHAYAMDGHTARMDASGLPGNARG